jgi:hypothetical protein
MWDGWMGGRVGLRSRGMGGPITSFNMHISHVKKKHNEERGTSLKFFCWKFSVMKCLIGYWSCLFSSLATCCC